MRLFPLNQPRPKHLPRKPVHPNHHRHHHNPWLHSTQDCIALNGCHCRCNAARPRPAKSHARLHRHREYAELLTNETPCHRRVATRPRPPDRSRVSSKPAREANKSAPPWHHQLEARCAAHQSVSPKSRAGLRAATPHGNARHRCKTVRPRAAKLHAALRAAQPHGDALAAAAANRWMSHRRPTMLSHRLQTDYRPSC